LLTTKAMISSKPYNDETNTDSPYPYRLMASLGC
jgi:hypothetical protein